VGESQISGIIPGVPVIITAPASSRIAFTICTQVVASMPPNRTMGQPTRPPVA
jgi:hypothetical protein